MDQDISAMSPDQIVNVGIVPGTRRQRDISKTQRGRKS